MGPSDEANSGDVEVSRKELRDNKDEFRQGNAIHSNRINPSRVVNLSWQPRVFLYRDFLSDEECVHLINLANGEKDIKMGANGASGKSDGNSQRGTSDTQLNSDDTVVARIEERLSTWTLLPKENSKSIWITHYGVEEAGKKFDFIGNKSTSGLNEPLMAVVILYLSNVSHGGGIIFPELSVKSKELSDCTKTNGALSPIKGNAVLFFTANLDASPDKGSSHSRCPVLDGDMWYATKFFHLKSIKKYKLTLDSSNNDCTDEDGNCPEWAARGECQKNPVYMIGSPDYYGTCRKSCNDC
ncbi:hypothetical protein ACFE04_004077 [Oxalis oulophora]